MDNGAYSTLDSYGYPAHQTPQSGQQGVLFSNAPNTTGMYPVTFQPVNTYGNAHYGGLPANVPGNVFHPNPGPTSFLTPTNLYSTSNAAINPQNSFLTTVPQYPFAEFVRREEYTRFAEDTDISVYEADYEIPPNENDAEASTPSREYRCESQCGKPNW